MKLNTFTKFGLALTGFVVFLILTQCTTQKEVEQLPPADPSLNALTAANNPDKFVWELFCSVFNHKTPQNKHLQWENWATEVLVYENPCIPPIWPGKEEEKTFGHRKTLSIIEQIRVLPETFEVTAFADLTLNTNPYLEEARMNKPMFDYIRDNQLYEKGHVMEMAKAGKINLPAGAVIVKAQWKTVTKDQLNDYYWKIIRRPEIEISKVNGALVFDTLGYGPDTIGLAAFHLVSHVLPNWVWSTFEHVDNPGRCDYIGCHDSYGFTPYTVPPNKLDSQVYAEPMTQNMNPELAEMFRQYGVPKVFNKFRLKGSMTEFTNTRGKTLLLGSSVLEANLVETSSCISCHARATLNPKTGASLSMFAPADSRLPFVTVTNDTMVNFEIGKAPNTSRGWHPTCYTGTPIQQDYFPIDSVTGKVITDSIFYQTDLLWQLAQDTKYCE